MSRNGPRTGWSRARSSDPTARRRRSPWHALTFPGHGPALAVSGKERRKPTLRVGLKKDDPLAVGRRGSATASAQKRRPQCVAELEIRAEQVADVRLGPVELDRRPAAPDRRDSPDQDHVGPRLRRPSRGQGSRTGGAPGCCRRRPRDGPTRCPRRTRRPSLMPSPGRPNPRPRTASTAPIDERYEIPSNVARRATATGIPSRRTR